MYTLSIAVIHLARLVTLSAVPKCLQTNVSLYDTSFQASASLELSTAPVPRVVLDPATQGGDVCVDARTVYPGTPGTKVKESQRSG